MGLNLSFLSLKSHDCPGMDTIDAALSMMYKQQEERTGWMGKSQELTSFETSCQGLGCNARRRDEQEIINEPHDKGIVLLLVCRPICMSLSCLCRAFFVLDAAARTCNTGRFHACRKKGLFCVSIISDVTLNDNREHGTQALGF